MATQKRGSSSRQGAAKKAAPAKASPKATSSANVTASRKAAQPKKTERRPKPTPAPTPWLEPVAGQFGPRLRAELEEVARSEARILRALKKKEISQQFLADPAAALNRMGVKLPPILKQRLKDQPPLSDLVAPKSFRLPNGQIVTATVNVRFTARKEG